MRTTLMMLLMTPFAVACTSAATNDRALCDGLDRPMTEHAAALAHDGGQRSLQTGDRLVRIYDAACQ